MLKKQKIEIVEEDGKYVQKEVSYTETVKNLNTKKSIYMMKMVR